MRQFKRGLTITLYRVIDPDNPIDLTPFLVDGGAMHTHKSVRDAAGSFSLTFADKIYAPYKCSLYDVIAPMDCIEIRGSQTPAKHPDGLPILMRCWVTEPRREKSISSDGKVTRRVSVTGQDIGKLMLTQQMHMLPTSTEQGLALSGYGILTKYFSDKRVNYSAPELVAEMAKILDKHLKLIASRKQIDMLTVVPKCSIVGTIPAAIISPLTEMSYHQFMTYLLDVGPFNELFTEDFDLGSSLVVRPMFADDKEPEVIHDDEIIGISMSRTDAHVGNWFWVLLRGSMLLDNVQAQIQAIWMDQDVVDARGDDSPVSEKIYGWRKMQVDGHLFPPGYSDAAAKLEQDVNANEQMYADWLGSRLKDLRHHNLNNATLESGTIQIRGNEKIKAGRWVAVVEGSVMNNYYVVAVDHSVPTYGAWITTLTCERGTGYTPATKDSPGDYLQRLNLKGAL